MARLVIGVGNPDRGDDAAGVLVARRVKGAHQAADCSVLLTLWSGEDDVVVVDAMQSGQPAGTVTRFDPVIGPLPIASFPSTHSFGIAEAVELARALDRLPAKLRVYGIEGTHFGLGETLSPGVAEAVERVADELGSEDG